MAIIEYDHSPNISPEQRLKSLADSVRRAFEEIENEQSGSDSNKSSDAVSVTPPIYISKSKKSVSIGEAASDDESELFNVAWEARFKDKVYVDTIYSNGESINFYAQETDTLLATLDNEALHLYGDLYLPNTKDIYMADADGTYQNMVWANTSNQFGFGYGSYINSKGRVYYDGNTVYFRSKTSFYMNQSLVFNNAKEIKGTYTNGTTGTILGLNASNCVTLGYINYANKAGTTDIYGGGSSSTLAGVRLLVPNLTDGGLVGAVLWTSTSSVPAYFRPTTSAKAALGSTSYKWYRLYQSESSVSTSDRREKENITALKDIRKVRKKNGKTEEFDVYAELFDRLEPVEYNFIEGEKRKDFGLIAQDIIEVMKDLGLEENELDLVHHDTWIDEETGEEKDGYGIAYENLIAVLIHEVQKLKTEMKGLKNGKKHES